MSEPASKPIPEPMHYTIIPIQPEAHLFEVTCTVKQPDPQGQTLALPAWIPGSYMVREFARNIIGIKATSKSKPVPLTKLDKDTWQAAPCTGALTLAYQVYAWDLSVRCAHLDPTHGFFNGTGVFLRAIGHEHLPHRVEIQKPEGAAYKNWHVATALRELKAKPDGFGSYMASNYDELVDHPVEMGTFALGHFKACGVRHDIVVTGQVPNLDMERLCRDCKTICEAQIRFFEPQTARAPFDRYVFLVMVTGDGYGGLEHRASTALMCARQQLPVLGQQECSDDYRNFLGLVSHEYFHSWNVKRIKPAAFAPYDFQRENHTSLLWIFEGFTSYYDDLVLLRTGLLSREQYFKLLGKTIASVLRGSGRLKQSVAESSFDAWTKYYRQDENAPNTIVSYYQKGALVALALDLHLRHASQGKHSLDTVMRALWQKYGVGFYPANNKGLGENEFAGIVLQATGIKVQRQVQDWAYGTSDLPLENLLQTFGIKLELKPEVKSEHERPSLGIKCSAEGRVLHVYDGSAARAAGLSAGDTLVALGGLKVQGSNLDALLARHALGEVVDLHAFRRDELQCFKLKLRPETAMQCQLSVNARAGITQQRQREAWLSAITGPMKTHRPKAAS